MLIETKNPRSCRFFGVGGGGGKAGFPYNGVYGEALSESGYLFQDGGF